MTPLTELTQLMKDYADRHGIESDMYIKLYSAARGALLSEMYPFDKFHFLFTSETEFLTKIKQ